jgi:predicted dehydrogenase
MSKKTVNIGLIGYKFMGKAHSNAYRQVGRFFPELPATPVLRAICGRDEKGVSAAAAELGWETYETDWRKLIARDDIDIVDIVTPGNMHCEIAMAAAEAGKNIICEKPLGNTAAEAKRMLDAVQRAGVHHGVVFNYRKAPAIALAKMLVDDGTLGKIYHWRGTYLQDWIVDPSFPLVWRLRKDAAGSGSHGDLAAHLIDTARYLVGEIVEVSGLLETFVKQRPELGATAGGLSAIADSSRMGEVTVDDASLFLARFDQGALGTFEATRFALERMNELEIYTEDSAKGTRGFRVVNVTEGVDPYSGHYWPAAHIIGYEHTFVNLVYDAICSFDRGENASPNFVDGYRNNVVLDAVEQSSATKRWVEPAY